MTILAWHNDPALKADAVKRMGQHRDADEFFQGDYVVPAWDLGDPAFRGCFHGCLTAEVIGQRLGLPPSEYEGAELSGLTEADIDAAKELLTGSAWSGWWVQGQKLWGIPVDVAHLLDEKFECQSGTLREIGDWAVAATEAIPVGSDLSGVVAEFDAQLHDVPWEDEPALLLRLLAAAAVVTPDA